MPKARFAVGASNPVYWETRPALPAHAIERPTVSAKLTDFVDRYRVTVVLAPAGFGKTAALSAWASQSGRRLAWLSLTPADRHGPHLRRGLQGVLETLDLPAPQGQDTEPPRSEDSPGGPPVLIIDDIQFADSVGSRKNLVEMVERTDPGVRIVLAGRYDPKLGLSRLRASGELGQLGPDQLAFTAEEVHQAAVVLGRELTDGLVSQLIDHTGGWPVAVRLALMSEAGRPFGSAALAPDDNLPQVVDYLVENLLDHLPARLAAFVLRACVCDRLSGPLADELSVDGQGAELLEEAVGLGIPLERRTLPGGDPIYLWHPVMAQAGRALLQRRDPALSGELHRRAARHLAAADPYEAVNHALRGGDPALAAEVIRSQWLVLVLRGDSEIVDELCGHLPSPWSEDPEILVVLATCRRNRGDAESAAGLSRRAAFRAIGLDAEGRHSFDVTLALAQLFLADLEGDLISACDRVQRLLELPTGLDGPLRACAVLLLGWSKMRLRRGLGSVALLNEAVQRCHAEGLDDLADRARASSLFSRAFGGDFAGALAGISEARADLDESGWRRADGAVEAFTQGWISFWSGDCDTAMPIFSKAVASGGAITSVEPLARVWLVHAALTRRNRDEIADAQRTLDLVPEETIQGMPWQHYKRVAQAGISLYRGDSDSVIRLLDEAVKTDDFTPAARVLAAELYWRCGRPAEALAQTEQVLMAPDYLRASGLVISALCARASGDIESSGDLLEEALGLGFALGISRPFQLPDESMVELLIVHAARGTRFESFLAEQLAWHGRDRPGAGEYQALSARERQILGYLATTMSASEICEALFVSPNTLKTHLKSIYRKLGVDNRRDATRLVHAPQNH